jgi:transcriptional/translational regulatory protein YebC/TACO1
MAATLADPGSVAYIFNRKGVVIVPKGAKSEDDILEVVLDAGAEEVNDNGDSWEIVSEATDVIAVRSPSRTRASTSTRPRRPSSRTCRSRSTWTAPRR